MEESYIWGKIQNYYGETKYKGSTQSIQNDRTILGKPFKRWYIAPAAMVFQAICGSVYAWSVFNLPVDNAIYGSDQVKSSSMGLSKKKDDAERKREKEKEGRGDGDRRDDVIPTPEF